MTTPVADIGLIGLAVMGQNLVLNMNDHGYTVVRFTNQDIYKRFPLVLEAIRKNRVASASITAYYLLGTTMQTTLTSKGQVTIPRDVRQHFGLKQGMVITFQIEGDHIALRAAPPRTQFSE